MANSLETLLCERRPRAGKPKKPKAKKREGYRRKLFQYSWPQRMNLLRNYFELIARGNEPKVICKLLRCEPEQIEQWIKEKQTAEEQVKLREQLLKERVHA